MLNLNDAHLAALITKPLTVAQARQQIGTAYQQEADRSGIAKLDVNPYPIFADIVAAGYNGRCSPQRNCGDSDDAGRQQHIVNDCGSFE